MSLDYRTYELRQLRPRLRDELSFSWQSYGGAECYVLEDEANGAYFRIGLPEYTFLSLLDGHGTVGEALSHTANVLGADALNESQAASIVRWLADSKLIVLEADLADRGSAGGAASHKRGSLNPLSQKIPFGSPQSLLSMIEPILGGLFSVLGLMLWLVLMTAACWQLVPHTDRFWQESAVVLSPHNWLWIAAWGVGLKVVHELSHGLACVRFGGRVRDAGIVFLLFAPIPYVDLTSTWRLPKWHRIVISLAGMLAELSLAAIAAIAWANTTDELMRQHLLQLMLTASVVTLLFNANPLMRFDGYYVLADWLELPNLAIHGQQLLVSVAKRWLLGASVTSPNWPEGRTWLVALYGIASAIWRTVVSASLIVAAAAWWDGVGMLLAVGAIFAWFIQPLWRSLRYIVIGSPFEQPSRIRFVLASITVVAGMMLTLDNAPTWNSVKLPGVVEYVDAAIVRAEGSGFLEEVGVESGQIVGTGEFLFRLTNPELEAQRRELNAEVERSELRSRVAQQAGDLASMSAEDDNRRALQTKLAELNRLHDALVIRAPRAGMISAGDLRSLIDSYVTSGQELLVIGDPDEKEVRVLIAQDQFNSVEFANLSQNALGEPGGVSPWTNAVKTVRQVRGLTPPGSPEFAHAAIVRLNGDGSETVGQFHKVDPRATTHPPHPAFCAGAGGPVATKISNEHRSSNDRDPQEFLDPHVVGYVKLDPSTSHQFGPGQLATVQINGPRRLLRDWLLEAGRKWFSTRS
ncbi:MAG: hypothetical protein NT013_06570 [Planctomycetia bacterium]|nr:hypothetical protein [Planctomycetia bacterium]